MESKYGVDKAIPQFYIKWITKMSFVQKIIHFLVCEPFFFYHRTEKGSPLKDKPFCTILVFVVKTQLKATHAHLPKKIVTDCLSGNELLSWEPLVRIS